MTRRSTILLKDAITAVYTRPVVYKRKPRELQTCMCTYSCTGAAKACDGATGKPQIHDPPLLFDLERDKAEATPLESSAAEYWAVVEQITRRREELLWDIATDRSVSTANYNTDGSAVPCCDPQQAVCRCDTLG